MEHDKHVPITVDDDMEYYPGLVRSFFYVPLTFFFAATTGINLWFKM